MEDKRTEHDLLGQKAIPAHVLYGIHTARAIENFPITNRPVNPALIHAFGAVKLACVQTSHALQPWKETIYQSIASACEEMFRGDLDDHVLVDALQGGAGTSTNMNVNEVIANRALQILGKNPGDYATIHPIEDINKHQSTNDTYPTALKVAIIARLTFLERRLTALLETFQHKEKEFAHVVKIGRTQMQDAVLTTMGRSMSAYAEAISRDRWRIFKCVERIRVVNLGGTAIGTGLNAPRKYIFKVTENLKKITGFNLARAENLLEATQNTDAFAEISGILKACASNFQKIASDLRFLSAGPKCGIGELILPERQAGSSIMPGKVNPVIPEAVIQVALVCMANDIAITQACSLGNLELNPFLPLIADKILENIDILANACQIFNDFCVSGLDVDATRCRQYVENSTATITALVDHIGYERAQSIAQTAISEQKSIKEIVISQNILSEEQFRDLISPEAVNRLGSR